MSLNVLVTGTEGQLGKELVSLLNSSTQIENALLSIQFDFTNRQLLDITQHEPVESYFLNKQPDIVINCAAYTHVDKAEENADTAHKVNHLAVENLALLCKKYGATLIHISTDYVYNGLKNQPYTEDDSTSPLGIYGQSKWLGEKAIQEINPPGSLIIRTSWLYSRFGNNFVKTMIKLGTAHQQPSVVNDQIGSPTCAHDLAKALIQITIKLSKSNDSRQHSDNVSIYHFANQGEVSWYNFAKAIFEFSNIPCTVKSIPSLEYPTPAQRPPYSVLATDKVRQDFDLDIPYWRDSLKKCVQALQQEQL